MECTLDIHNPDHFEALDMVKNARLQKQSQLIDSLFDKVEQISSQPTLSPADAQTIALLCTAIKDLSTAPINQLPY